VKSTDNKALRRAALTLLARRDHTSSELVKKLTTKGYSPADVEHLLHELRQAGYLNEARLAENFIHYYRQKGYGPERIAHQLISRGISAEIIAEQLQITDNGWFNDAYAVWQKRFKGHVPNNFNDRAKQMRFLQYRGFTREQILSVFRDEDDL